MILIITPHVDLRRELSTYLKERNYSICIPEHRQDIQQLSQQLSPEVIVLDLYISQPNGLTVLQELRAQGYPGKVLALGGISNRNLAPHLLRKGVDQIINFSPSTSPTLLLDQIESMIRGFFHEKIARRAYEFFIQNGKRQGHDLEDWLNAEKEVLEELKRPKPHLSSKQYA